MRKTKEFFAVHAKKAQGTAVAETIFVVLFLFLLVVLGSTWFRYARVFGVVPDVLFVFCICLCIEKDGIYPVIISVFSGILKDICAMRPYFFDAFLYLYISAGCVWVSGRVFLRKKSTRALCVALATVLYDLFVFFIKTARFGAGMHIGAVACDMCIKAVYHAVIAILLYPIVAGIQKKEKRFL